MSGPATGRIGWSRPLGRHSPLQRQYSYLLQQWLGSFVVDDAHAEAIRKLETILGLEITVRASEDLNREQASDARCFKTVFRFRTPPRKDRSWW